jgi:hypothetical protein
LSADDSALLGGVDAGGCGAESAGSGTCAARGSSLVAVPFIEAQPETERITRNPAIPNRRIDGSRIIKADGSNIECAVPLAA